jgi:hypothetical protein
MNGKVILVLCALSIPTAAFGVQENRGLGYCASADLVCSTSTNPADSTRVCVFKKSDLAVVIPASDGQLHSFDGVKVVSVAPGVYGAGETYAGDGFSLHIETDVYPGSSSGTPSTLSTPSLSFDDLRLNCIGD